MVLPMTIDSGPLGAPSEGTMECRTGAILLREGARAVGSTFARPWDSEPEREPGAEAPTPAPPPLPLPLPPLPPLPLAIARAGSPARDSAPARRTDLPVSVPWSFAGAFALGAAIAALAGLVLERGAVELAALASAVAGGMTLSAALGRLSRSGRRGGTRPARERR